MEQDKYYFILNNEACCQLHLFVHDNSHSLYTERQQQQQQKQQEIYQHQDLYVQQRTTPRLVNLFSPLQEDINRQSLPTSGLDITAGDNGLQSYSTLTSTSTTLASHSFPNGNHLNHHYGKHPEASLIASSLCSSSDKPTVPQSASSVPPEPRCPNVIYSYDTTSESFSTLLRDGINNSLFPGPNATWEDIRHVTSDYGSDNITVLCTPYSSSTGGDVDGSPHVIFENSLLNNTFTAVTSTHTYTPNVSSLLQSLQNLSEVNFSIVSKDDYLQMYLGKRYLSSAAMVALMSIYSLIFFTGVLGNVCTCLVIARNRFLHTATNYYLFSLAISDVLTLLLGKYILQTS
ncbi:neuromedin-U receptor 1 [Elysia marginata]|uniref:Neuromedin-U receptor 1 n=1 Tax=Elysia marginata TaxID=1093978 RepID=A0AAV4J5I6_9GAST|nr:neuromedin-U receptor 1 [Elysia marginata]